MLNSHPRQTPTRRMGKALTVGAVYDRAVFSIECDRRAVIDRAYSRGEGSAARFPSDER
jgi:hypothetical protein